MHYYHRTKVMFSSYFPNVYHRDDNENCVVCTCGQPATLLTVKKDGPNKGKSLVTVADHGYNYAVARSLSCARRDQ